MMKVIKIKVKTIILSIFILFFTIPYIFYFIGVIGFEAGSNRNETNIKAYTSGFLKLYEHYPTFKIDMGRTYYMLGMSNYDYIREVLYYYSNGTTLTSTKSGNMEQALIAKSYFEKGIELGKEDSYYVKNLNALINLEMVLGNGDKAFDLIMAAKDSKNEVIYQVALVNEIIYYAKQGDYDNALNLCNENEEYLPVLKGYKNTINYIKGDIDKIETEGNLVDSQDIEKYNEKLREEAEKNKLIVSANILKDIDFVRPIEWYEKEVSTENINFAEISGKVTVKGKAIANTAVILHEQWGGIGINPENGRLDFNGSNYKYNQTVYTDENGEFTFNKVFPNVDYGIILSIPSIYGDKVSRQENVTPISLNEGEKINVDITLNDEIKVNEIKADYENDEIVVKYEEYPSAYSYGVDIGVEGYGIYINEITSDNEIRIPLTKGSLQSFLIMSQTEDEEGNLRLSAKSYLGFIDIDKIYIRVTAYDKEGRVLSKSTTPIEVKLKKKKLNKGERLILDYKIDEGYNWLYEKLKDDPMNKEYIYPVMRIAYERGDIELGDELINRLEEINKTGFDKKMREWYVRE
ncbi:MAG: carboxypeptidase-like regulatory domain-containing protein [Clostridium celatum]|nr:carboxypeptidase-like regulatory domain-containing protein [Clostridium celatum]